MLHYRQCITLSEKFVNYKSSISSWVQGKTVVMFSEWRSKLFGVLFQRPAQSTLSDRRNTWSSAPTCPRRTADSRWDCRRACCSARRWCSWGGRPRSTAALCWGCWTPRWWRRARRSQEPAGSRASARRTLFLGSRTSACRPGFKRCYFDHGKGKCVRTHSSASDIPSNTMFRLRSANLILRGCP